MYILSEFGIETIKVSIFFHNFALYSVFKKNRLGYEKG